MRRLYPDSGEDVSYDDLVALYAFPLDGTPDDRWVRANFVSSLDGAAQGPDYRSGSLSSAADQHVFALQRTLCDLVLVGATTTRVEGYRPVRRAEVDVALRARLGLAPVPTIAVVSRSLSLHPGLLDGGEAPTVVVTCATAPADVVESLRARVPVLVCGDTDVDVGQALAQLVRLGHRRVLCEGGPSLLAHVVAQGCLDDLCLTFAPELVGGDRRRILHGPELSPTVELGLAHLLEEQGHLFARYSVERA